jgi:polysaccharide pyruvyl transferase WcaK-like protein
MIDDPRPPRRLRIGLLGQFGIGNLGNEASLEAMLRFLRAQTPDAALLCICTAPDLVQKAHGVRAAPLRASAPSNAALNTALLGMPGRIANFRHALRTAKDLDVVIVPGTGALDDFNEPPGGLPYDLWRWRRAADWMGAKVAFVSVGAGPIVKPLSRMLMTGAARGAAYRSYRDQPSKAFARAVGLAAPQDRVFPDLAFGLPAPAAAASGAETSVVAVGVMAYSGWMQGQGGLYDAYVGKLAAYVAWLLQGGRRVRFVIGKDKDVAAVDDVQRRLPAAAARLTGGVEQFEPAQTIHDVMGQMASADIAVVTRFHNLVAALRVGTPAISLGYAEKNRALLEDMELGAFSQDVENFDLVRLQAQTERLLAEREARKQAIVGKIIQYEEQLRAQERLLLETLLHRAPPTAASASTRTPAQAA